MIKTRFDKDLIPHEKASVLVEDINIRSRDLRAAIAKGTYMTNMCYSPVVSSFGPSELSSLIPIFIDELQMGTVHVGRVLYGTVSSLALPMSGIHMIIRDYNDEYVVTSVYDFFQTSDMSADFLLAVDSHFHLGVKVAIKNPFYKPAMDGNMNVRIDTPSDFVCLAKTATTSLAALNRAEGNKLFKLGRYISAGAFYTEAIQTINPQDTLAESLFGKGDVLSIMASILPTHEKTQYPLDIVKRAAKQFEKIGLTGPGDICRMVHSVDSYHMHIYTVLTLVLNHIVDKGVTPVPAPLASFSLDDANELFLAFSNRAACILTLPDGWRKVIFDATIALAIGHAEPRVLAKALFRLTRAMKQASEPELTKALATYGMKVFPTEAADFKHI